jgi:hypothetical protein
MNALTPSEQFDNLAEEVISIVSEKRFDAGMSLLEMRHEIGSAILRHPLFKKNARGQGQLLTELAARVGLGETSLRYTLEFATKYKSFDDVVAKADPDHKLPSWRDIVHELPSGKRERPEPGVKCSGRCKIHRPQS